MDNLLKNKLRDLEIELHKHDVRNDQNRLNVLLHDEFIEFGYSGSCYDKDAIIAALVEETEPSNMPWSQEYQFIILAQELVQLLYKSAHVNEQGELSRHSVRTSIWQQVDGQWKIRFHQGTPTSVFERK